MNAKDTIISDNLVFHILNCESKEIFNPDILGITPIWTDDTVFRCSSILEIKEYQLYLKNLIVKADIVYPMINGIGPHILYSENEVETVEYRGLMIPIPFSGAVIIGSSFIRNYGFREEISCYSYMIVRELIFQEGKLVTTIDHSKAMLRIRKNLDLGLRKLDKPRDLKCIKHFIKTSFIGDYEHSGKRGKKRLRKLRFAPYLQKLKNYYLHRDAF